MSDATDTDAPAPAEPMAETLCDCPVTWSAGQQVVHPTREQYLDVMWKLRDDEGFEMLTDLCGADYLTHPGRTTLPAGVVGERFEVVVELLSLSQARRLRVRVQVPADDPTVPTLYDVYPGADALEREAADMFGLVFDGHPDPNRILMPEDWDGHPLRKDYSVGRIPVQFKAPQSGA